MADYFADDFEPEGYISRMTDRNGSVFIKIHLYGLAKELRFDESLTDELPMVEFTVSKTGFLLVRATRQDRPLIEGEGFRFPQRPAALRLAGGVELHEIPAGHRSDQE